MAVHATFTLLFLNLYAKLHIIIVLCLFLFLVLFHICLFFLPTVPHYRVSFSPFESFHVASYHLSHGAPIAHCNVRGRRHFPLETHTTLPRHSSRHRRHWHNSLGHDIAHFPPRHRYFKHQWLRLLQFRLLLRRVWPSGMAIHPPRPLRSLEHRQHSHPTGAQPGDPSGRQRSVRSFTLARATGFGGVYDFRRDEFPVLYCLWRL